MSLSDLDAGELHRVQPSSGPDVVYLLAEHPATRNAYASLVASVGLRLEYFESPPAFLESLQSDRIGCLVLDMPGNRALVVQRGLLSRKVELPIIIATADSDIPTAVEAIRLGAFDFLYQPFTQHRLLERIQKALVQAAEQNGARAMREEIAARWARLSDREKRVAQLLAEGKITKEIASILNISSKTADNHRAQVLKKMQAGNPVLLRKVLVPGNGQCISTIPFEPGRATSPTAAPLSAAALVVEWWG